ncbi:MAG: hypothetical protein HY400_07030 [Elusimicrobia bacterium]|nr:hypothetical protein [Elusimicrobiota bacterium]
MRYWVYFRGRVLGPYPVEEIGLVEGFGPDTLVCVEGSPGDHEGDWKAAELIPELASLCLVSTGPQGHPSTTVPAFPEPTYEPPAEEVPLDHFEQELKDYEEKLAFSDWQQAEVFKSLASKDKELLQALSKIGDLEDRLKILETRPVLNSTPDVEASPPIEALPPAKVDSPPSVSLRTVVSQAPTLLKDESPKGRECFASSASPPVLKDEPPPSAGTASLSASPPVEQPREELSKPPQKMKLLGALQPPWPVLKDESATPSPPVLKDEPPPSAGTASLSASPPVVEKVPTLSEKELLPDLEEEPPPPLPFPEAIPAEAEIERFVKTESPPISPVEVSVETPEPGLELPQASLEPQLLPLPQEPALSEDIDIATVPEQEKEGPRIFLLVMILTAAVGVALVATFFLKDGIGRALRSAFYPETVEVPKAPESVSPPVSGGEALSEAVPAEGGGSSSRTESVGRARSSENTQKAIQFVKDYSLGSGRGTVAQWLQVSYLAGPGLGVQEDWSATLLEGDVYSVQYKVLKPGSEPIVYLFGVHVDKQEIRGLNNSALELLSGMGSRKKSVIRKKKSQRIRSRGKKRSKKRTRRTSIPQIPLPPEEPSDWMR